MELIGNRDRTDRRFKNEMWGGWILKGPTMMGWNSWGWQGGGADNDGAGWRDVDVAGRREREQILNCGLPLPLVSAESYIHMTTQSTSPEAQRSVSPTPLWTISVYLSAPSSPCTDLMFCLFQYASTLHWFDVLFIPVRFYLALILCSVYPSTLSPCTDLMFCLSQYASTLNWFDVLFIPVRFHLALICYPIHLERCRMHMVVALVTE